MCGSCVFNGIIGIIMAILYLLFGAGGTPA